MEKKRLIGNIIFNVSETLSIIIIGRYIFCLPIIQIIFVLCTFMCVRNILKNTLHFKTWYRCCIWSILVFCTIFFTAKIGLIYGVLFTIFSAYIMTGKSNINDLYLWKPANDSKYKDIEEYVKYNEYNTRLLDFEDNLRRRDNLLYLIYKYRFKERMTFSEMSEKLDMENPRIVEKLNQIALAIRINCGI